jgi:cytochrome o ubiquinol oxidase operon protein cyoD
LTAHHESHGAATAPHQDHSGADHGSVGSYTVGFVLSVILTAVPFALIIMNVLPAATAIPVCVGIGVVQIIVHLIYFLHMNIASSRSWNMVAFVFTIVIVSILVGGSLWVMYHLDTNMMPGMMPAE